MAEPQVVSRSMSWTWPLLERLQARAASLSALTELWVLGSAQRPEQLDRWSDLDLGLVLAGPLQLAALLGPGETVWALDQQSGDAHHTCRVVFTDGRRLDLVVAAPDALKDWGGVRVYAAEPRAVAPEPAALLAEPPTDAVANEARFVAALAVVKHGRSDQLIATHLALELAQICLVEAMQLRDLDQGTNQHRYGTSRDALAAEVTAALGDGGTGADVATLERLAALFDRVHAERQPAYVPDWSGLSRLAALSRAAT